MMAKVKKKVKVKTIKVKNKKLSIKSVVKELPGLDVKVRKIDDSGEYVHKTLGITDERLRELVNNINTFIDSKGGIMKVPITDVMIKISDLSKHANELVYVTYIIGTFIGEHFNHRNNTIMGGLNGIT